MTDTEREALCARIDELCAEVERLRNQLRDQQDTAEHNFVRNAREYKRVCDENAKLREERDHWHVEQVHAFGNWEDAYKRAIELEKQNAKLRELMYERAHVYAIQNMTEDELRITATNVMEDNAKLRELFSSYWKRTHSPVGPNVERDYLSEMRELGIEVD